MLDKGKTRFSIDEILGNNKDETDINIDENRNEETEGNLKISFQIQNRVTRCSLLFFVMISYNIHS